MTEIDDAMAAFVEAEIKEHQAALIRQMVAVEGIICFLLILVGLHQ
jgi:penicillin-binding protein-related factor A (putative recombinase)